MTYFSIRLLSLSLCSFFLIGSQAYAAAAVADDQAAPQTRCLNITLQQVRDYYPDLRAESPGSYPEGLLDDNQEENLAYLENLINLKKNQIMNFETGIWQEPLSGLNIGPQGHKYNCSRIASAVVRFSRLDAAEKRQAFNNLERQASE